LVGFLLGLSAPVGAIIIRIFISDGINSEKISAELDANIFFYLYMGFGSIVVVSSSGWYLGRKTDKLRKSELRYYQASIQDPLTNLYNRRFFDNRLAQEFERAIRYNSPLTCLMLDIDHFKRVNDSFGHDVGDLVLQRLSAIIQKRVREFDILARYGGEEFVLLLPQTPMHNSYSLAEQIRTDVEKAEIKIKPKKVKKAGTSSCSVTISIGISGIPDNEANKKDKLLKQADVAMYHAKQNGRNQTVIFSNHGLEGGA